MCHADFRGFVGSYWCYFKGRFCIVVQVRPNFGRNPFRAAVEHDDEIKMQVIVELVQAFSLSDLTSQVEEVEADATTPPRKGPAAPLSFGGYRRLGAAPAAALLFRP